MKKYTVLGLFLSIFFVACGMGEKSLNVKKHNQSVDYSKKENWLKFQKNTNKECDVFFVHPTTWELLKILAMPMLQNINKHPLKYYLYQFRKEKNI